MLCHEIKNMHANPFHTIKVSQLLGPYAAHVIQTFIIMLDWYRSDITIHYCKYCKSVVNKPSSNSSNINFMYIWLLVNGVEVTCTLFSDFKGDMDTQIHVYILIHSLNNS